MDTPTTTCPEEVADKIRSDLDSMVKISEMTFTYDPVHSAEYRALVQQCVDEIRQGFPHLDDLTLAGICDRQATIDQARFAVTGDTYALSSMICNAMMAVELAWELTGEAGS